jgi:hypothetical protein
VPVGKIALTTNNRPEIRGSDDGIWRRKYPKPQYSLVFINPTIQKQKNSLLIPKNRENAYLYRAETTE